MIWNLKTELLFFILSCFAVNSCIGYPFWPSWSPPFHANNGLAPRWNTYESQHISPPQVFHPNFPTFGSPPASNQYFPRHDVIPNPWGGGFNSVKQNFNGGSSSDVHEGFGNEGPKARTFGGLGNFESLFKKVEGIGTAEGLISKGPFPKFEWSKTFEANKVIDSTSKPQFPLRDFWSSKVNSEHGRQWFRKPFFMNANNEPDESSSKAEAKTEEEQAEAKTEEEQAKAKTEEEQAEDINTENKVDEKETQDDEPAEQTPKTETENQEEKNSEQNEEGFNEDSAKTEVDEPTTKPETEEPNTTENKEEETKSED